MGTKGNLGKLEIDECEDITGGAARPRPRHRPPDNVQVWMKHVQLALAVDELRKAGYTYEKAVPKVADDLHASEATVKRAYGRYIRELEDPNSAEKRRKWQNEAG